jgi:hypothetical protein
MYRAVEQRHERGHHIGGGHIAAQFPAADALLQPPGDALQHGLTGLDAPALDAPDFGRALGLEQRELHGLAQGGVLFDGLQQAHDHALKDLAHRSSLAHSLGRQRVAARGIGFEQRLIQPGLAGEVPVDGPARHAGPPGDALQAGGAVAARAEFG